MEDFYNKNLIHSIVGIGLAGNLTSILVFSRKKFTKFNAKNMFM